ncbi:zinc finger protein [Macleaya cordata]|uniref:E3 ubiquitin-protein ligase listerin n=1 Tax=Macleaya cordata TaxID=56857 RepID=A0A200R0D0_MACCD|nr:zinc finger protein [Macleaya cordata]
MDLKRIGGSAGFTPTGFGWSNIFSTKVEVPRVLQESMYSPSLTLQHSSHRRAKLFWEPGTYPKFLCPFNSYDDQDHPFASPGTDWVGLFVDLVLCRCLGCEFGCGCGCGFLLVFSRGSRTCQIKHWREGHKLECEEFKSLGKVDPTPTSSSGRRATGHVGISYSQYQQSTKDEALAEAKRSLKKNSGKEFQTVEECPICISIIRTNKHSRPSLACDTCKHKFHSSCISKWFSISKKSNCPLCGSLFRSGGGLQQSSVEKQ